MHRNPQGWISHCAPPTDELKMTPITVRLPRPRPFSQLIGRCHALCYVIGHKAKNLVPVPKLPVTQPFDCKQKKGGGPGIATIHRAPEAPICAQSAIQVAASVSTSYDGPKSQGHQ
jgi:hypothetical protein